MRRLYWVAFALLLTGCLSRPAPAALVRTVAGRLERADGYTLSANVSGTATMRLAVSYRSRPRLMQVDGDVDTGGRSWAVSYWLAGNDLYVKDPQRGNWYLHRGGAALPEVGELLPGSLGRRLREAATDARVIGEERWQGARVWVVALPAAHGKLYAAKGSLQPVAVQFELPGGGRLDLEWVTWGDPGALALPDAVRKGAVTQ